ncbi:MAG: hypothetical protein K2J60_03775 [Acetatifactor sp.]|nr:hypothetical protein [Acetatifactor sp.]
MCKTAIGIICAGGLSVMCLAGCGKDAAGSPKIPTQEIQQNNVVDGAHVNKESDGSLKNDTPLEQGADNNAVDNESSGSVGDGAFLYGANLYGSVVKFSDEGFSLSPATTEKVEGGGEVMAQAASGSESDENNIQITYTDNTVFQIVNLSRSLQSEISREDTDKESVKKQSSVCVFGSCQDTYHWTADKILILRWQ